MRTPIHREGTAEDVVAVVALVNLAYRGVAHGSGWTNAATLFDGERTDESSVRSAVEGGSSSVVLVAESEDRVVGCCQLLEKGTAALVGTLAVDPDAQGAGIGRGLVDHAEEVASGRWGSTSLEITVITQRRELVAWYERLGFVATGERHAVISGEGGTERPLRDDLEFMVMRRSMRTGPAATG